MPRRSPSSRVAGSFHRVRVRVRARARVSAQLELLGGELGAERRRRLLGRPTLLQSARRRLGHHLLQLAHRRLLLELRLLERVRRLQGSRALRCPQLAHLEVETGRARLQLLLILAQASDLLLALGQAVVRLLQSGQVSAPPQPQLLERVVRLLRLVSRRGELLLEG